MKKEPPSQKKNHSSITQSPIPNPHPSLLLLSIQRKKSLTLASMLHHIVLPRKPRLAPITDKVLDLVVDTSDVSVKVLNASKVLVAL